jgi:TfoX/Sxy family transcriptional regulator of competence genes
MAYDEHLADRIRRMFQEHRINYEDKKMMGGICFLVNDKMCLGVVKDKLMARIDPVEMDGALLKPGCREMDFTHKPMKGFVFVEPAGIDMDKDLEFWIQLALEYNPRAKSSQKKRKTES